MICSENDQKEKKSKEKYIHTKADIYRLRFKPRTDEYNFFEKGKKKQV